MTYDERKLSVPDNEPDEKELPKCACCLEEVEEVFELGTVTYGLRADHKVCSFCLNQLHQNLTTVN